jgi:hypothetical protein
VSIWKSLSVTCIYNNFKKECIYRWVSAKFWALLSLLTLYSMTWHEQVHCWILYVSFSSARTKFCRCLNLRQNQNFLTPVFYHFSRRFRPPTTRFRKKILVSGSRFSVTIVTHHRNIVQTSFWCQNAGNFNARNWLDYYACSCDASNEVCHAYVWRHV